MRSFLCLCTHYRRASPTSATCLSDWKPDLLNTYNSHLGSRSSVVVRTLRYKPEVRGFETRLGEILISLPNPFIRNRP
jgi:hypothetical protein